MLIAKRCVAEPYTLRRYSDTQPGRQPETKLGIAQTNTPHKTRAHTLGSLKRYPALLRLAGKPCVGKR
ncbi:MAG: hypothetical protein ACFNS8_06550 [Kingella oralis]